MSVSPNGPYYDESNDLCLLGGPRGSFLHQSLVSTERVEKSMGTRVAVMMALSRRKAIPYLLLAFMTIASAFAAWSSSRPVAPVDGPEGVAIYNVPNLAPANTTRPGYAVDGITCQSSAKEVVKYHIHVEVSLFVNGQRMRLPAGVGITAPMLVQHSSAGTFDNAGIYDCLYWLHTHVDDGVIHVEAPQHGDFTLGQFFNIWGQPLGPRQVGPERGQVVVFENGQRLTGDPRLTPLLAQGNIQIDVGNPVVPYVPFTFRVTGGCGEGTTSCSG